MPITYNNFKVTTDPRTSQVQISLTKDGKSLGEAVDTKDVANLSRLLGGHQALRCP